MTNKYDRKRSSKCLHHKTTQLGLEQLETRMMNAVGGLEQNLQLLLSPSSNGSTQVVSASTPTANSRPTVQAAPRLLSGSDVRGKTTVVTVTGADDQSESRLVYTWQATSGPAGGIATFATNNTNGSKQNTVTFNKPGVYVLAVTIRDQGGLTTTSNLQVNVVQTVTSIVIRDADNRVVSGTTALSTTDISRRFTAVGLDQFGSVMAQQPSFTWATPSIQTSAAPRIQTSGNTATFTFSRSGTYAVRAQSGSVNVTFDLNINSVLSRLSLATPEGTAIGTSSTVRSAGTSQRITVKGYDQFGTQMSSLPTLVWSTNSAPAQGSISTTLASGTATIQFNRAGIYSIRAQGGTAITTFQLNVSQTLSGIRVTDSANVSIGQSPVVVGSVNATFKGVGLDQFGQTLATQPAFTWTTNTVPLGATAKFAISTSEASVSFDKVGTYSIRATSGLYSQNISISVVQSLTRIAVTSSSTSVASNATMQFSAQGLDQFGKPMASQPTITWTATGGTVSSTGLYKANTVAGAFRITAKSGTITTDTTVTITAPAPVTPSSSIRNLAQSLYADNSISRSEMMQILRSAGTDGSVSQTELDDLRAIVGTNSTFNMPSYVRELAKDVVNSNPANLKYKGQNAGNLVAGSNATLLNNLVDKWFLGADEPAISGSGLTYQVSVGNLFNGTPSRADAKQGYLGDCYFIASLTSIADASADAIRNMFIDNGDGTYTVRFFSGNADYVTVNRRLPAYSNGMLGYSGVGQAISSLTTTLWVALAEKAYAQWNETGNAGRNGTNTYSGIEGGWMSNVNSQVLGYGSTNYSFATTSKQTLINSFGSGRAVTLGTNPGSTSGLVGSHAYVVTGYNASTDKFAVYNPWGNTHPAPLSWEQLQANCSMFVVTDSTRSTPISTISVRSSTSDSLIGSWTVTSAGASAFATSDESDITLDESDIRTYEDSIATIEDLSNQIDEIASEWASIDQEHIRICDMALAELGDATLDELNSLAVDFAMSFEDLDSILG